MPYFDEHTRSIAFEEHIYVMVSGNAWRIRKVAELAYERLQTLNTDMEDEQPDAMVAILFSLVSLEAWINEIGAIAGDYERDRTNAWEEQFPLLNNVHQILTMADKAHLSLEMKVNLLRHTIAGSTFDKGSAVYQDFQLLVKLRNALTHARIKSLTTNVLDKRVERSLESRNLFSDRTRPLIGGAPYTWIDLVSNRAAARWALNASASMSEEIYRLFDYHKDWYLHLYLTPFNLIQE